MDSVVNLFVTNYKCFDRSNSRHGQILTVKIDGRTVDVECVDKEDFDFSGLIYNSEYKFRFVPIHRFRKALSKNGKEFYLNYLTYNLTECLDIQLEDIELD